MAKSLTEILEENDVILKPAGSKRSAVCPFHEGDRTPSFVVYPNETYFCFACKVWGDAVKFLVDYKKMPPEEAMTYVGMEYKYEKRKNEVIKIREASKLWPFLYEVAEAYHKNLLRNPGPYEYLVSRGLSMETISKHMIGYTDGRVLNIQDVFYHKMGIEYGILTSNGYERMGHRITIPNLPETGRCDFIIGRTVTNDKVRYLNTSTPKPIYGLTEAWPSPVLFITEGHFDWLLLREWGYPSIVIGGTNITSTNISILRKRNVVIVPDNDAVGLKAALDLKKRLGQTAIILDYTAMDIKDISEAAQISDARNEFGRLVREQLPWQLSTSSPILAKSFTALKEHGLSLSI